MLERKRSGQLQEDLQHIEGERSRKVDDESAVLSGDEIYERRLRDRQRAEEFTEDEVALYAAIRKARMMDGSFKSEEENAWREAVVAVHDKTGGNVSRTAERMKLHRSTVQGYLKPGGQDEHMGIHRDPADPNLAAE